MIKLLKDAKKASSQTAVMAAYIKSLGYRQTAPKSFHRGNIEVHFFGELCEVLVHDDVINPDEISFDFDKPEEYQRCTFSRFGSVFKSVVDSGLPY